MINVTHILSDHSVPNGYRSNYNLSNGQMGGANSAQRQEFNRKRSAAMRSFVDQNISNPDFRLIEVCESFGASRATAYRVFSTYGGIAQYLKKVRLEHAYRDLKRAKAKRGQVANIAEKYCFFDKSQFARAFRQRFGVSPSEVLAGT